MNQDGNIDYVYRTSSIRTLKMLIIMVGICISGAVVFFSMWDYWISFTPNSVVQTDIESIEMKTQDTGSEIYISLSFIESADFRTLAFNALPGEENHNPEIKVSSGDIVTLKATNNGKSFHSFGIVKDPENLSNIVFDSDIKSPSNPLKPGESGDTTFIAGEPGLYYYICTVPGHALQGMKGTFIVE